MIAKSSTFVYLESLEPVIKTFSLCIWIFSTKRPCRNRGKALQMFLVQTIEAQRSTKPLKRGNLVKASITAFQWFKYLGAHWSFTWTTSSPTNLSTSYLTQVWQGGITFKLLKLQSVCVKLKNEKKNVRWKKWAESYLYSKNSAEARVKLHYKIKNVVKLAPLCKKGSVHPREMSNKRETETRWELHKRS